LKATERRLSALAILTRVISEICHLADECHLISQARKLAAWVGEGKPVTANGVVRRADVAAAAAALGVDVPARVRTAADVEVIHRPWVIAQAIGMVQVDATQALAAPAGEGDPPQLWLTALDAVLRAESHDRLQQGADIMCRTVLLVLATDPPPPLGDVEDAVNQVLRSYDYDQVRAARHAFQSSVMPVSAALGLLEAFGAVDEEMRLTPLGRWAREQLQARVPQPITPDLPAGELLTRLAALPEEESWEQAGLWFLGQPLGDAVTVLLRAASAASPLERITAVGLVAGLGRETVPAWREALADPGLVAHARAVLASLYRGPELDDTHQRWLIAEYALAELAKNGVEDAYHYVADHGGMAAVERGGHPGVADLIEAFARFAASGGTRIRIYQVKIALSHVRPPVWRRVLMPASATLGLLHRVIRVIMGWGDDHLHAFTADGRRYSDPTYGLEECGDEDAVRLARALPRPGTTMSYVYDFGDNWQHMITLEKILDPDDTVTYPICVTGRGDAPVEDWNPDCPEDETPFDKEGINRRLAELTNPARHG
jgi:hypothetical protein